MPTLNDRLITAAARTARTADRLGLRFSRQLTRVLRDLERELAAVLPGRTVVSDPLGRAGGVQVVRQQVRGAMSRSGFAELMRAGTGAPLDRMAAQTQRIRALLHRGMPAMALPRLEALREVHLLELLQEGQRLTEQLARVATRGVFADVPRRQLLADLARQVDRSLSQMETLYDTTLSIYGREIEAMQAGDNPAALFVYLGPADAKTRRFCRRYVGKVLTRQEIDQLDNGQMGSPFLTGGGYNCRHLWSEISPASDLAPLHGSGGRMPEVRADVRRLAA